MKACRGQQTCAKCGEKDLNHMAEDCLKEIRCSNCQQGHPAYARSCDIDKKEKEIVEVKPKMNVSFQKARKTVGFLMGENMFLLHGEWIQSTQKMNTELLWSKRSYWNQMIGQSFRITWKKKYTWPNFSKHKLKKLKRKRNSM